MTRIDAWLGNSFPLGDWTNDHDLGVDSAAIIADKATPITVIRSGTAQAAQTVRLEGLTSARQVLGADGNTTHTISAIVFGYKGHPTITDTSLQPGDRFAVGGVLYEVIMLVPGLTDSLQALCEAKR
jgi:hypothetical protein